MWRRLDYKIGTILSEESAASIYFCPEDGGSKFLHLSTKPHVAKSHKVIILMFSTPTPACHKYNICLERVFQRDNTH
jgi:hypothetical protein